MESSKFTVIIREDNELITIFESKFERKLGDIINYSGTKFKVIHLAKSILYARGFIGTFKKDLFQFHKF